MSMLMLTYEKSPSSNGHPFTFRTQSFVTKLSLDKAIRRVAAFAEVKAILNPEICHGFKLNLLNVTEIPSINSDATAAALMLRVEDLDVDVAQAYRTVREQGLHSEHAEDPRAILVRAGKYPPKRGIRRFWPW